MFLVDLSRRHDFHLSCDSGKLGVSLGMILDHHLTERLDVGSLASFSGHLSEPHLCQPNNRHLVNEQARISPTGLLGCRSEEHTSELQSQSNLVCRLLLEKK